MKKLLAGFFAFMMCFAVIGCGDGDTDTPDATGDSSADPTDEEMKEGETPEEGEDEG